MRFNKSSVGDYASHTLSIWYGECIHGCRKKYCFVDKKFGRYPWANGPLRVNKKAIQQCKFAKFDDVKCLIIQFSGDPLPMSNSIDESKGRIKILMNHLRFLELRGIPTKVLTKNTYIQNLAKYAHPYEHIEFGMSITTDSENWKETEYWEKGLPSISRRLDALEHLKQKGFRTWASMEPILPKTNIRKAITDVLDTGVSELWVGKGSYVKKLENAFSWGQVARQVLDLEFPQIHLKKELKRFLKIKEYQTVLQLERVHNV